MRKILVIATTSVEVDPTGDRDIAKIIRMIAGRTITVVTRNCIGEAVVIAGKIITSLFLVRNDAVVKIKAPGRRPIKAFIVRRDEERRLAELKPALFGDDSRALGLPSGEARVNTGPIQAPGGPLLIPDAASGKPAVKVAGMRYAIRFTERRDEDVLDVLPLLPPGQAGGGVWNLEGEFVGLSLASKVPYFRGENDGRDMLFSLPAEAVLDFVEST